MAEVGGKKESPTCPHCGSSKIYRSRRRGAEEWFLHYFRSTSPYRCKNCDGRFLRRRLDHPAEKELHHHPA
jgi:hypothetical protein